MHNIKKLLPLILVALLSIFGLVFAGNMSETVGAGEIVIMQDPLDGDINVWSEPGWYYQNFGHVTRYKKSDQYWFSANPNEGAEHDQSIKVRFNDFGHAQISGSLRYDLPADKEHMKLLHMKYGSQEAIEKNLIGPIVTKAIYFTGPLMSSTESASARRSDLLSYAEDQLVHGVYKTTREEKKVKDSITGQEKTITVVNLILDAKGGFSRQEKSPLDEFGIRVYNLNITTIDYSQEVEGQIKSQQAANAAVQTAMAHSKEAEQRALTVEQEGKANAAKAKWDQETLKAKAVTAAQQEQEVAFLKAQQEKSVAVTKAEQEREVAQKNMQAAEFTKKEQTLLGEGEAARARAVMNANGALEQKLEAWKVVNLEYAKALAAQPHVPQIQISGSGASGAGQINDLLNMLQIKTAKDLQLSVTPRE